MKDFNMKGKDEVDIKIVGREMLHCRYKDDRKIDEKCKYERKRYG